MSTLIQGWRPIGLVEIGLLAIAAALRAAGYLFIVNSMRHGEMSVVAPFRYTGLLLALRTGFVVWGELPNAIASSCYPFSSTMSNCASTESGSASAFAGCNLTINASGRATLCRNLSFSL